MFAGEAQVPFVHVHNEGIYRADRAAGEPVAARAVSEMSVGRRILAAVTLLRVELAVPCTRNPLNRGRTSARGPDGLVLLRLGGDEGRVPRDVEPRTP